ncbi:hypothetical protein ES703_28187 [subsurface metagenome]
MPEIATVAEIAEKWGRVTPMRVPDYQAGVERPRRDWETETIAAAEAYEMGITAAMADNRFQGGVRRAGTEKWRRKTLEKGPGRWAEGVRVSEVDYAAGFEPYRDEIARIVLPPRGPRGDPRNIERVRIIAEALHALKLRLSGGRA